jgi:hypothetical protein
MLLQQHWEENELDRKKWQQHTHDFAAGHQGLRTGMSAPTQIQIRNTLKYKTKNEK